VEISDEQSISIIEKGGDDKSMKSYKSKGSIKSEVHIGESIVTKPK